MDRFRAFVKRLYTDIESVNQAWGTKLTDFSQVSPPADAEEFFTSGSYFKTTYGKDFIRWYRSSLLQHGHKLTDLALSIFSDEGFEKPAIGVKVPGIHWQVTHPTAPRTAEICAGLINADDDLFSPRNLSYYKALDQMIPKAKRDRVILHFTCLEMNEVEDKKIHLPYSAPKRLVGEVGKAALALGIQIKGENALGFLLQEKSSWRNMRQALIEYPFQGITFLRIGQVAHPGSIGNRELKKLIHKCRPKRKLFSRLYQQE